MSQKSLPIHVVCAVILNQGRVLLAQRPEGKRLAGCWEFPGGKIEKGETPEQALHREILEELGCRLQIIQSGPVIPWSYPWGEIVLQAFLCEMTADSPMPETREHQAFRWLLNNELSLEGLAPADGPVVDWLLKECPFAPPPVTEYPD